MSRSHSVIPILPAAGLPGIEASRNIQPRAVNGVFARWRWAMVWATQLWFYGMPWLNWHGRQAVLFDLEGRRFYIFGTVLFPQDLVLLTGVLVFSALLLFAATALYGRVWCGFACPQTVYTEIFAWVEHRTEGDRLARMRLDDAPWSMQKIARRGTKHLAWGGIALLTGFSLVGWFTPVRALAAAVPAFALGPWEGFWILFYAAATYLHAGVLKEKICQHACPYGRFQGSMLDSASRVITYDVARGEPRGSRTRGSDARTIGQGDCIDCTLCVQVCPVGIDIRKGLQAECISCGLCIDACNGVMDKMKAPRGLISFQALSSAGERPAHRRGRVLAYGAGLALVGVGVIVAFLARPELRLNVIRDRSVMSRQLPDGGIENVYRLRVMNASLVPRRLDVHAFVEGADGIRLLAEHSAAVVVEPAGTSTSVVSLRMDATQAQRFGSVVAVPIRVEVIGSSEAGGDKATSASTFIAH